MTAQIRRGAPTVQAAHALDREPTADPITAGQILGGIALVLVLIVVAFLWTSL